MKKRVFAVFCCGILLFAAAGCGTNQTEVTEESAAQEGPAVADIFTDESAPEEPEQTEVEEVEGAVSGSDFILPDSDTRYYSESELDGLSKNELRLARNEIYARRGRKFDDTELQSYFDGKTWYQGTIEPADFTDSMLNTYEKENIKIIQRVENSSGQSTAGSTSSSGFSFADIEGMDFVFSSGVGAWGTGLIAYADGTFEGEYSDWNGGPANDEYPGGEYEYCEFTGKFSDPVKVNDYTYSFQVESLNFLYEPGTSEIRDEFLFNYTDAYGIDAGDEFLIYLPGAPTDALPVDYLDWIYFGGDFPSYLPFYGLYNTSEGAGYRSY